MGDRLKDAGVFGFLTISLLAEVWANGWPERAALAFAIGALGLVTVLPRLRSDDGSGWALVAAVVALGLLVSSAVIAVYVVHSWAWLLLAGAILLVGVAAEAWERYQQTRQAGPGIDQDIAQRQRRQDEQLRNSFPRP